ncbi:MAG: exodeoxyribonuclease VII large subunit, partial [Apilactobacillus kunkeei]|nr:exodeoxyribonuclease VII large subunit [Apilactobacillus kunkeei]
LKRNIMLLIQNKQNQLTQRVDALDHLSPLKVMSRGFSFTTNSDGKVVKKVDDIKKNDDIELKLIDGYAKATVNEVKKESK